MGKVIDLPRANAALARLEALLTANPELRDRTQRMMAGELPCAELEEPMGEKDKKRNMATVPLRLPHDWLQRADDLAPILAEVPDLAWAGSMTRAAVLRLAIREGLNLLESQHKARAAKGGKP